MENQVFLSVVIPVYNEAQRIQSFLKDVVSFFSKKDFSYEIVFVDDGSRDNTVEVISATLEQSLPGRYRFLRLAENQGKGGALKKGMLEAVGDYVLFLDADGSTAIDVIDSFVPQFDSEHDIYIAVRSVKHDAPFKRKFFGYGYIYLANLMLRMDVSDFTCGFKCYRRQAAQEIFSRQTLNNWSFDAEDLYISKKFGFKIKEIVVYWKHVGGSKVKVLKNVIVCGFDLLTILFCDLRGKYK